jgi:hypothetical protein
MTVSDSYLTPSTKDLADSGNGSSSVMFKVKETVDHGRYAFMGWLYDSTSLTTNGTVILNRTLKWLKYGDAAFGGQNDDTGRKGNIAFICDNDDCQNDNEMNLIKYLRINDYSVVGKEKEAWTADELNNYGLIICSDSRACEMDYNSPLYSAHKNSGKAFLEIPYKGGVEAAELFGYVHSKSYKKSGFGIVPQGTDTIFSGFKGYMEVLSDRSSIYGPIASSLNPATTLAKTTDSNISTMFIYDAAGGAGRYAYIGWVSDATELTENGGKLLTRTVDWLICGHNCMQEFNTVFGNLSLNFEVNSPVNKTYDTSRVYVNVSANQRVKEITIAMNDRRPTRLCRDCNAVYRRLSVVDGANRLNVTLTDYTGKSTDKTIYFFVNR